MFKRILFIIYTSVCVITLLEIACMDQQLKFCDPYYKICKILQDTSLLQTAEGRTHCNSVSVHFASSKSAKVEFCSKKLQKFKN